MTDSEISPHFFSGLDRPTSFFILRHGESTANAERRIQGPSNFPLNDRGRAQAKRLAEQLRGKNIQVLFHSPLDRAAETAEILAEQLGIRRREANPVFAELNTGMFTGLTLDEIENRYPDVYKEFKYKSWAAVPDAESEETLYARALSAWATLKNAARESGGNIAVVTHGGTIQWLIRVTFGCRTWMPILTTGNCAVFELEAAPVSAAENAPAFIQWKHINYMPDVSAARTAPVF